VVGSVSFKPKLAHILLPLADIFKGFIYETPVETEEDPVAIIKQHVKIFRTRQLS
jgi:hypothetical protein